tara:strand:+ start:301 stop:942 length:642 start_codon:yes stop_codon:yes gene_type:complete
MGFLSDLLGGGTGSGGFGQGISDWFQGGDKPGWMTGAQSLLGAGMMGYGAHQMANPSINQGYLSSLNANLSPLQASADKMGDLASQYEDPNSEMNQRMRNQLRTQNLDAFTDIAQRQRSMATGEYGTYADKAMDQSMLSDALGMALRGQSQQTGQNMKEASNLYQNQAQINQALSQAGMQNQLMAQQQASFMPQYLSQTGATLLQNALQSGLN